MKVMRFYILYQKYRIIGVLLLCSLLTGQINAQDNTGKKTRATEVTLKVVDDNGNPLPNAKVVIGEGVIHTETDQNGTLSFVAYPGDFVTISLTGYEKSVSLVRDILINSTIKLTKSKLYMTTDDDISLPFLTIKKRNISGSSSGISSKQLEKYPSIDIRNAFTGLATGVEVLELNGQPGMSPEERLGKYKITPKIDVTARGHSMVYIIDNIPVDITEMPLDPAEIESITMIKDIVGKAMYGPVGADGIIFIKTKRGHVNERVMSVNVEDGVSVIDRFPQWVSGSDYATLNNQARTNNGLTPNYLSTDISAYAKNDPYDRYHPSINFKDMLIKNTMSVRKVNISSSGGNERLQYAVYLGYNGAGDIYKIGSVSDYNRITARGNVDMKINDFLKVQFNFYTGLNIQRSPNYKGSPNESNANMSLVQFNSVLQDITTIPPVAFPVYANNDPSLTAPWYGVSNAYKYNPIGDLTQDGSYNETGRIGMSNLVLEYDMKNIIKGLKSVTYVGFNVLDQLRIGKAQNYDAYIATPNATKDNIILTFVHSSVLTSSLSNLHDFYSQRFAGYESLTYDRAFDNSNFQSALTYSISKITRNGFDVPLLQQNAVWTGIYSYNDKYSLQGVLNYAGSSSFASGKKYELFPSVGISWIVSEESFMSNLKFINYLKLRADAGILGYDGMTSPYYFRDNWATSTGASFGAYSTGQWFGSNKDASVYRTTPSRIGNSDIVWEKRKEFSVGIDALMMNQKLALEVTYYNNLSDGVATQLTNTLPLLAGISSTLPFFNYNKIRYFGVETGVKFTSNFGKFKYSVGGNATIQNSKYLKYDEPDYRFAYQKHTGTAVDSYWGQTYLGKFESDAETVTVPQLYDAVLYKGDLKYQDMNNDGVVDDNDQSVIGHSIPRLVYALSISLNYKNFEMTLIGTGRAIYDLALTNKYYWNGWGDNTYSYFVKDNIGGDYPRLTYNKVNNNFVNYNFWLTKGNYFKMQNIEFAYDLPSNTLQILKGGRGIRLFVRGANLLTITKVKDVDPESINSGIDVYPLFRTFTGGIKLTF
jgi:TonB-linked SusC/RagA family outer membrane protein